MGNAPAKHRKTVPTTRRKKAHHPGDAVEKDGQQPLQLADDFVDTTTENDKIEATSLKEITDKLKEEQINAPPESKGIDTVAPIYRDELIDLYGEKLLIKKKRAQFRKDMNQFEEILDPEGFKKRLMLRKATTGNLTMKQKIMRIRKRLTKKKKLEFQNQSRSTGIPE